MALPKRRHSSARRDRRRTHWKLEIPASATCPQCAATIRLHRVCDKCGYYGSQQVIKMKEKKKA
ncbi:MAG: 50S ribosomal protein L32 [Armatimonadetes bacterium]|nr:50S ribosomal protein L32 [Armatimonadota bacterium]